MSVTLINGNGNPAVYASQDSDWFGAITGNQTVIMNVNQNLAYELLDNNTLVLKSGVLVTKEGRRVQIDVGDTEEITIPTGTQNVNRFYICGFKLTTDSQGVQSAETFIEQMGSSTETITEEQFKDGATTVYVSLYRIYQSGITIDSVSALKSVCSPAIAENKLFSSLLDLVHPVGSIYMSVNNTNPGTLFGGTWVAWGSGRVPVGVNASDADFNTVEKQAGAKTVTLTKEQSGLPAHSHGFTQPTVSGGAVTNGITGGEHYHGVRSTAPSQRIWFATTITDSRYRALETSGTPSITDNSVYSTKPQTHTHNLPAHTHSVSGGAVQTNNGANANQAHNNLQPYITCYMWKRTA